MRVIKLDAARWRSASDFYDELLALLGAPERHGRNVNALIDSMIWGGINDVDPPYEIRIANMADCPRDALEQIEWLRRALPEQRAEFRRLHGSDVEVQLELQNPN